jgi:peptidyl-prolyl cis-trans isomerase SurA
MKVPVFVFLCLVCIGGFSQNQGTKALPLFTVENKTTFTDEFIYLYRKNHSTSKEKDFTTASVEEYSELLLNFKLKIAEAHHQGLDTTAKFMRELKTYREELKKPYRAEKDVMDKLTKEAYEHSTQEVKASHILIQVSRTASPEDTLKAFQKISAIRDRVLNGEDFEKLARESSEDPSAKSNGGNLGYFTAMQMVYPFEKAAYDTKVGGISSIIRTQFGYHLIKVDDKRPSHGEVEISHILLRAPNRDDAKVRNKIFDIYDQLKAGRSWDELCKENSEDTNTKNSGGRLRQFGIGVFASVPEFETMAFALKTPGEISDPFQSNIGWHIIRLEKKIPVLPYAEAEPALRKKVARDERVKISEKAEAAKRRKEFQFSENAGNKAKFMSLADSNLTRGKWKFKGADDLKKNPLFSINSKPIIGKEFITWIFREQSSTSVSPATFMEQLYENFVDEKLNEAEDEKLIAEHRDFRFLLNEYREGILLFEIMEKEVWNKASADSSAQKKFYESHLDKYKAGPRIEARFFATADKAFFDEAKRKIANKDTLTASDMKKFKSVQPFRKYEKGESKVIDRVNWVPGLQEITIDNTYYLVEVARLVEPGTKAFNEARSQVISDYQTELEKQWVSSLKKKYAHKIDSKGKKFVMTELVKK